jgi:hypothetical protein
MVFNGQRYYLKKINIEKSFLMHDLSTPKLLFDYLN